MKRDHFEQLILEVIAVLPRHIREVLNNVAFVVEQKPRRKKAKEVGRS